WIDAEGGESVAVDNPATEKVIGQVPDLSPDYIDGAVDAAVRAFDDWRDTSVVERADKLLAWHQGMLDHAEELARLMTLEQGKPIGEARDEVSYAASFLRWFAEQGRRAYGAAIPPENPTTAVGTILEPVGVAAIITPWNFPLAM